MCFSLILEFIRHIFIEKKLSSINFDFFVFDRLYLVFMFIFNVNAEFSEIRTFIQMIVNKDISIL